MSADKLLQEGLYADEWLSSTCLDLPGRPEPHMVNELMRRFDIRVPNNVLKVDDTNVGLLEGHNAGCQTIGVAKWSIHMGVQSVPEIREISASEVTSPELYSARIASSMAQLGLSNPTTVVESLDDVLEFVNLDEYIR